MEEGLLNPQPQEKAPIGAYLEPIWSLFGAYLEPIESCGILEHSKMTHGLYGTS